MKQQRMTKQKQLVLKIARANQNHPTADQIYLEVRAEHTHISRGTVYRNLEQLSEAGMLLHVKVPGADRFDSRIDYHYHMVCTNCRRVLDAPIDYQYDADKSLSEKTGLQVIRHRAVFEVVCSECSKDCNQKEGNS